MDGIGRDGLGWLIIALMLVGFMQICNGQPSKIKNSELLKKAKAELPKLLLPYHWTLESASGLDTLRGLQNTLLDKKNGKIQGYFELEELIVFVQLFPGDVLMPHLTSFNKEGEKQESLTLSIGGYGAGCGISVNAYQTISEAGVIRLKSSSTKRTCEENGAIISEEVHYYNWEQYGQIKSDGKIEMKQPYIRAFTVH